MIDLLPFSFLLGLPYLIIKSHTEGAIKPVSKDHILTISAPFLKKRLNRKTYINPQTVSFFNDRGTYFIPIY